MSGRMVRPGLGNVRISRPSLVQVRAIVEFIQKHPDLAHRKIRNSVERPKTKKLWRQLANILNSLGGTVKTTKGWIKYWYDKRRTVIVKQQQIQEGKTRGPLFPLEQKIYDLCANMHDKRRKKAVKVEPCNGDDEESISELSDIEELDLSNFEASTSKLSSEAEERQISMMEKIVDIMDQQTHAMAQLAQSSHVHSKALDQLADASHIQAIAVDRVANSFENINASVHDVRNAIMSIDYTVKRCYSTTAATQRQNSNIFS